MKFIIFDKKKRKITVNCKSDLQYEHISHFLEINIGYMQCEQKYCPKCSYPLKETKNMYRCINKECPHRQTLEGGYLAVYCEPK